MNPSLQSRSLSGQPFAINHHVLLRTAARFQNWNGNVWVPARVAAQLHLPLRPNTAAPVKLQLPNGTSYVYHSEQFTAPVAVLQAAWDEFVRRENQLADPFAGEPETATSPACIFPLNTNGERFDRETEERMIQCGGGGGDGNGDHRSQTRSRYWVTAAEASYVFATPLREAYLADPTNAVVSNGPLLCPGVSYSNVEGTTDPTRFTPNSCRRYDPVNYSGAPYRPCVAVVMKAFALRYGCLHERQWITTRRASYLGLSVPRSVNPISFMIRDPVHLVNVAVLQRSSFIRGRVVHSSVSPAGTGSGRGSEEALEESLLMLPGSHVKGL
jgi:hypothetical protein